MQNRVKILVADDDPGILSLIKRGLVYEGYDVVTATNGKEALEKARDLEPDAVILDVMMPEVDGLEVARRLRSAGDVPVLILTARGTVGDRVAGLDSGADDYLVKPFAFEELLARLRALLRRRQPKEEEVLRFADVTLNTATREVKRADALIEFTTREFDLLELFMRHPRQVLRTTTICEKVWGYDFDGESNVIEVYISYLRSKLETGGRPRLIQTVRGVGYVLKEE